MIQNENEGEAVLTSLGEKEKAQHLEEEKGEVAGVGANTGENSGQNKKRGRKAKEPSSPKANEDKP